MNTHPVSRYLDQAILIPQLTRDEVIDAIRLGIRYDVKTVCVRPCDIPLAVELCKGTNTEVSCVLAFPHGCSPAQIKAVEASLYISQGVNEIDMVANYGYIRSGLWDETFADIKAVADLTKTTGVALKVIFETSMLTLEEIKKATEIAIQAGADFVKTSTGFNGEGATIGAVETMLKTADGRIKVKPSGGVRDYQKAMQYIEMGCHRLGINYTSTVAICEGAPASDVSGY